MIDAEFRLPNGKTVRFRKRLIPTREQAQALLAKKRAEAFEGRYFDRAKASRLSVEDALTEYEKLSKRDNRSWKSDRSRAAHLSRHLGAELAATLTRANVEAYRNRRFSETTVRGKKPSPATLDREIELLKRALNFAVACGELDANPLAGTPMLNVPNVREVTLSEADLERLLDVAEEPLRTVLLIAYDTGFRKQEVLGLRWSKIDQRAGCVRLTAADTKSKKPRIVYLSRRAMEAIERLPRILRSPYLFARPGTGKRVHDVRKQWAKVLEATNLPDVWFHDSRRSFATNARRRGVAETVVMAMGGWKTPAVFRRYNIVNEEDLRAGAEQNEAGSAREREQVRQGSVKVAGSEDGGPDGSGGKRRNR